VLEDNGLTTTTTELKCERCGWDWEPMNPDALPRVCPRCKSYKWMEARSAMPTNRATKTVAGPVAEERVIVYGEDAG
jgi:NAD-dependent SIR2 family protein deacetylase